MDLLQRKPVLPTYCGTLATSCKFLWWIGPLPARNSSVATDGGLQILPTEQLCTKLRTLTFRTFSKGCFRDRSNRQSASRIGRSFTGLPDGLFLYQKSQFGYISECIGMENVGIFYNHFEYFAAIWYNLWPFSIVCGHMVIFWYIWTKKTWQPWCERQPWKPGFFSQEPSWVKLARPFFKFGAVNVVADVVKSSIWKHIFPAKISIWKHIFPPKFQLGKHFPA
jgi:hypothetical protein